MHKMICVRKYEQTEFVLLIFNYNYCSYNRTYIMPTNLQYNFLLQCVVEIILRFFSV